MTRSTALRAVRPAVSVRPIRTVEEYRRCMTLQQAAFGYEDAFVEPLTQLITAQRYGGAVLGAFDAAGSLVGYVYSCLGRRGEEMLHCFRLLAVSPAARGLGVGERLLLGLREQALADGIRTVVATYDPLEAANARLYLGKLGFRGVRYYPNHYGDLGRGQNEGLETDRLEIEWALDAAPPGRRAVNDAVELPDYDVGSARDGTPGVTVLSGGRGEWPVCSILRLDLAADRLLLEVPASIQAIKRDDLVLAQAWRRWTRDAFLTYVGSGRYAAVDFLPAPDDRSHPAYVLARAGGVS